MKLPTKADFDRVAAEFWQDFRRNQWHSRYSEPTEAMYAVIGRHGGHVMWPKYSDMGHDVFYSGPPDGTFAVHVYKEKLFDGGIYQSLDDAKRAAWDMRRSVMAHDATDLAIQVIGAGGIQLLFIGGFSSKQAGFHFACLEHDRKATPWQRIEDAKRRYQPWTKGKRK